MTDAVRLTSEKKGHVIACPECDQAGEVIERRGDNTHAGDPDKDYYCGKCKATFDDYVEREERIGGSGPKFGDLDPEDVGL